MPATTSALDLTDHLRRFGIDLCLGHDMGTDDPEPVYVGRLGLTVDRYVAMTRATQRLVVLTNR